MDVEDLRGFLEIARLRNLTEAAEELAVSQSTLSRRLQRLEKELGQPLFERSNRAMLLNDVGEQFLVRAKQIVSIWEEASAECADEPETGVVRVGAIPTVAPYLLPRLLMAFAESFPDASVVVVEDTTERLLTACREGAVDIGILSDPFDATHLERAMLYREELLLGLPAGHRLAEKKRVSSRDIEAEPLVVLNSENCLTGAVSAYCRDRSVNVKSVGHVHQLSMLQELVGLGFGLSLIPELAARADTSHRRVYRRLSRPEPTRQIVAVRNPYRYEKGIAKSFWSSLIEFSEGI